MTCVNPACVYFFWVFTTGCHAQEGRRAFSAVSGREAIRFHLCAFAVVCLMSRFRTYLLVVEGGLSHLQGLPRIWWFPPIGPFVSWRDTCLKFELGEFSVCMALRSVRVRV